MRINMFLAALCLGFAATSAQAFTIKNLSKEPYTLVIEQLGAKQEITLAPGERYIRNGVGIILHPPGRAPLRTHQMGEYAIWPDGNINIQRYDKVQLGD